FFVFSSRRRHTRSKRDWSSDVCSSDLITKLVIKKRPFQLNATLIPFTCIQLLIIIFKAFNGLIDDENIHVYIHIKAAVCNVTSISGVNNNGKTFGVDIIWWIPKKAISVIKTITIIKTNNTLPCADQVMALFKTVAIGVFINAVPKRPSLKNSAASILFLDTI